MQSRNSNMTSGDYRSVAMLLFLYRCPGKSIAVLLIKKDWREQEGK